MDDNALLLHRSRRRALVTGAGGFIGGHLVRHLVEQGYGAVRAVDIKPLDAWHQRHAAAENSSLDLARIEAAHEACDGPTDVFNLAADMGGMGFIETQRRACMLNVLINTHLLMAAQAHGVERFFFTSSACVYPDYRQDRVDVDALAETDAYPAMPEDGYGWEKLFGERMCAAFADEGGPVTRVARLHNVYGPLGAWDCDRTKAPAAICRKVAQAVVSGDHTIEIWGDGEQTRSFTWVDDCTRGIVAIHESDCTVPLNLGSSEQVTINQLVTIVEAIAGVTLKRRHNTEAPLGVRGRNSDNTFIRQQLDWAPDTSLRDGLAQTYAWILEQVRATTTARAAATEVV